MIRRTMLTAATWALAGVAAAAPATRPFRLGLTPVFLDNDAELLASLRRALGGAMGRSIELVQRRTYEEVTGLILEGSVDAAWVCGYPYVQHDDVLSLVAVPVWRGKPLYRSCLIVAPDDQA